VGLLEVVVDPDKPENPIAADVTALTNAEVRGSLLIRREGFRLSGPSGTSVGLVLLVVPEEEVLDVELASDPRLDPRRSSREAAVNALLPAEKSGHTEVGPLEETRESVKVGESPSPSSDSYSPEKEGPGTLEKDDPNDEYKSLNLEPKLKMS